MFYFSFSLVFEAIIWWAAENWTFKNSNYWLKSESETIKDLKLYLWIPALVESVDRKVGMHDSALIPVKSKRWQRLIFLNCFLQSNYRTVDSENLEHQLRRVVSLSSSYSLQTLSPQKGRCMGFMWLMSISLHPWWKVFFFLGWIVPLEDVMESVGVDLPSKDEIFLFFLINK